MRPQESHYAYEDHPERIGYNATISAPHMHAYCLEWLEDRLKPGSKVLDVGSGSGYLCAVFYEMTGSKVVGVEHIPELCDFSVDNLSRSYQKQLDSREIEIVCADGRKGYSQFAPYQVIHVGAAAWPIPKALIDQLDLGGKMVIPVGPEGGPQQIVMISKDLQG